VTVGGLVRVGKGLQSPWQRRPCRPRCERHRRQRRAGGRRCEGRSGRRRELGLAMKWRDRRRGSACRGGRVVGVLVKMTSRHAAMNRRCVAHRPCDRTRRRSSRAARPGTVSRSRLVDERCCIHCPWVGNCLRDRRRACRLQIRLCGSRQNHCAQLPIRGLLLGGWPKKVLMQRAGDRIRPPGGRG